MFQFHVFLDAGDEVDGMLVFPLVPLRKVDPGAIPDIDDFPAFFSSLAQGLDARVSWASQWRVFFRCRRCQGQDGLKTGSEGWASRGARLRS